MWGARALIVTLTACSPGPVADEPDASTEPAWATYVIAAGRHDAQLLGREPRNPIDGVASVGGRDYELVLDPSAIYELTAPTQPNDQLDWNKLPGLSDCAQVDLAVDGLMFGWRWSPELGVLEITAYANNEREHLTIPSPLVTLDAADLDARTPLRYRLWREPTAYAFEITGAIRGRTLDARATLPRRCAGVDLDPLAWASALYFGGTSVAPHEITAQIRERDF